MTQKPVEFHPAVLEEARAAFVWYSDRSYAAAELFMRELDQAVERIEKSPLMRPEYVASTRRYLFRKFPFSLIYRVRNEDIQVIPLAHARRRPGYWKARLANQ